jgi:hypothetical protein
MYQRPLLHDEVTWVYILPVINMFFEICIKEMIMASEGYKSAVRNIIMNSVNFMWLLVELLSLYPTSLHKPLYKMSKHDAVMCVC